MITDLPLEARRADPHLLLATVRRLRRDVFTEAEDQFHRWRPTIHRRAFLPSAHNLAAYLALRERDLRSLQLALMSWGLSSLGRSESRVLASLDAVIATLAAMAPDTDVPPKHPPLQSFFRGERLLHHQADALFGRPSSHRRVRIMVTLGTDAASDEDVVRSLVQRGMDCVRINCAHDTPAEWEAMIANVRRAEQETGCACRVLMDLGGPRARTGEVRLASPSQRLHVGERFLMTDSAPAPAEHFPAQVVCQLPEVLQQLRVGATITIDEGKLGAQVEQLLPEGLLLRVTHARDKGERLRAGKGLNFPGAELRISPLTEKDRLDLRFVAQQADLIGYSFVQEAADIALLQHEVRQVRGEQASPLPVIAKIETARAIRHVPEVIVQAAGQQPLGVMIARGDLAVEIGYERLAEMQEELLWVCEAAHIPVIWATQVLDGLVRKGVLSRAEMTDAAMAERAECVMLNKGPYIAEAITVLDRVLTRMQDHQVKKTPQLRALHMWRQSRKQQERDATAISHDRVSSG